MTIWARTCAPDWTKSRLEVQTSPDFFVRDSLGVYIQKDPEGLEKVREVSGKGFRRIQKGKRSIQKGKRRIQKDPEEL